MRKTPAEAIIEGLTSRELELSPEHPAWGRAAEDDERVASLHPLDLDAVFDLAVMADSAGYSGARELGEALLRVLDRYSSDGVTSA